MSKGWMGVKVGNIWRDLEGPMGVKSINFGFHFGTLLRAKMGVKSNQKTVPRNRGHFYEILIVPRGPNREISW